MSERKNIKRNARRPSKSQTPYLTAKSGSGRKSEEAELSVMKRLDEWNNLSKHEKNPL